MDEHNPFLALARALWKRGEDGEMIARDLALAFKAISEEGIGIGRSVPEYKRLIGE